MKHRVEQLLSDFQNQGRRVLEGVRIKRQGYLAEDSRCLSQRRNAIETSTNDSKDV